MKQLHSLFIALAAAAVALPVAAEKCADTDFFALAAGECRGAFAGSLNGDASEGAYLGSEWGGIWSYVGRSDDTDNGPFSGNPLVAFNGVLAFDLPLSGDFVIGLTAAGQYSYYWFHAVDAVASLTFNHTEGVATTPQGNPERLSHAALYIPAVPEPTTVALMLAGLVAVGVVGRRRRSA